MISQHRKLPNLPALLLLYMLQHAVTYESFVASGHWDSSVQSFATHMRVKGGLHRVRIYPPIIPFIKKSIKKLFVKVKNKMGAFGILGGLAI